MKRGAVFILVFLMACRVNAQDALPTEKTATDQTGIQDSLAPPGGKKQINEMLPSFALQSFHGRQDFLDYLLSHNKIFPSPTNPEIQLMPVVSPQQSEKIDSSVLFYLLMGLFFLLAIIRFVFKKYFNDLFMAFFSPALSRRQLKDQLYQTPFPSFALNFFFALAAGIYLYLILRHFLLLPFSDPFYSLAVFISFVFLIYFLKYLFLRISSWLFHQQELINDYIFTLFLINKVMGVFLLPFILIIALSSEALSQTVLQISFILVILLFLYRYFRVFSMIKAPDSFNRFHFFLYLCGFEIIPILVIGKMGIQWLHTM